MFDAEIVLRGVFKKPRERTEKERTQIRSMLSSFPFFHDGFQKALDLCPDLLENDYFDVLASRMTQEYFPKGKVISHTGETPATIMIVLRGKVGVAEKRPWEEIEKLKEKASAVLGKSEEFQRNDEDQIDQDTQNDLVSFFGGMKAFSLFCSEFPKQKISQKSAVAIAKRQSMGYSESDLSLLKIGKAQEYFEEGVIKYTVTKHIGKGLFLEESDWIGFKEAKEQCYLAEDFVYVAALDKEVFRDSFTSNISEEAEKIEIFERVFPETTQNKLTKLISLFQRRVFRINSKLFSQNEENNQVYLLAHGTINIFKEVKQNRSPENTVQLFRRKTKREGIVVPVGSVQEGEFLGEEDLPEGNKCYYYTAISASASAVTFSVERKTFLKVCLANDQALRAKSTAKAQRLKELLENKQKTKNEGTSKPPSPFRVDHQMFQAPLNEAIPKKSIGKDIYSVIKANRHSIARRAEKKRKIEEIKRALFENAQTSKNSSFCQTRKPCFLHSQSAKNNTGNLSFSPKKVSLSQKGKNSSVLVGFFSSCGKCLNENQSRSLREKPPVEVENQQFASLKKKDCFFNDGAKKNMDHSRFGQLDRSNLSFSRTNHSANGIWAQNSPSFSEHFFQSSFKCSPSSSNPEKTKIGKRPVPFSQITPELNHNPKRQEARPKKSFEIIKTHKLDRSRSSKGNKRPSSSNSFVCSPSKHNLFRMRLSFAVFPK